METWKTIDDYPNYEVSNLGKVRNSRTGRVLKQGKHRQGYALVWLSDDEGRHGKSVHRLVAETYIPNPKGKPQVNHIDGNKQNNCVDNLEWNTAKENFAHAWRTSLYTGRPTVPVRIVETGEIFNSIRECAEAINGVSGNVWSCIRGRLDSYKGLHFEAVE